MGRNFKEVNYSNFQVFITQYESFDQSKLTTFQIYLALEENLKRLKSEILSNLVYLETNSNAYFKKIKWEIESLKEGVWSTHETIEPWLKKYGVESETDLRTNKNRSKLFYILYNEPPTFGETLQEGFNHDITNIISAFNNYYYGHFIDLALEFIEDQIREHSPTEIAVRESKTVNEIVQQPHPVLSTNLTVPVLSLLFNVLNQLKPPLYNLKTLTELYAFISATHTTKKSKDGRISQAKLSQYFSNPDPAAIDVWIKYAHDMIDILKKMKKL